MLAVVSNIIVITDFVNLQYTCLPEAIYSICTPDDGWNCHPKHVKPLRRINAIVASCWMYSLLKNAFLVYPSTLQ